MRPFVLLAPMRSLLDRKLAGWILAACGLAGYTALHTPTTGDYSIHGEVAGDNAGPALNALVHGHFSAFLAHQPLMGLTSILLRAPFVAVAAAAHAGQLSTYRYGALACLLVAGLLAAWIGWTAQMASATTGGLIAGVLAVLVIVAAPQTAQAVVLGHPEEVLASVLAVAAVLAACAQRPLLAAVFLGLAIGTKQWALLAAIPVLLAVRRDRWKLALLAGALGLLLTATLPLVDPGAASQARNSVFSAHLTNPFSVWWPFGSAVPRPEGGIGAGVVHRLPFGLTRASASTVALGSALVALAAVALYRRRRLGSVDAIALLALLGLLRCVTDPTPLEYNFVDVLIPLAAWEAVQRKRVPVASIAAMGALWLVTDRLTASAPYVLSALALSGMIVLAAYLVRGAFRTGAEHRARRFIFPGQEPITGS